MDKKAVKYVQEEPAKEFLDPDIQSWNATVYGCYKRITAYMKCNGGRCPNDLAVMAKLCRCHRGFRLLGLSTGFYRVWGKIGKKFQTDNGDITNVEVSEAIATAQRRIANAKKAGSEGAKERWRRHRAAMGDDSEPIAKEKEKEKGKINVSYSYEKNCEISSFSVGGMRSAASLELAKIFHITPEDKSDITTVSDVLTQVEEKVYRNELPKEIFDSMVAVARGCTRNWGKFINKMKDEPFCYEPVGRGYK
jgi:hypothetical protein